MTALCHANAYVRDRLAAEMAHGLLPNGCHLRLDDAWQAGGIWRIENMRGHRSSLLAIPPTLALGLGYASSQPPEPVAPEPTLPIVSSSVTGWKVVLITRDIDNGEFCLSQSAAEALRASGEVALRLSHADQPAAHQTVYYDPERRVVTGIEWPFDVYPGIVVYGNVESGGTVVKARTKLLGQPVTIDGVTLAYEFDETAYRGANRRQRISQETLKAATTLTDLIHAIFRSRGRPTGDGGRKLTLVEVVTAILGPAYLPEESHAIIVALMQMDLEYAGGDYTWHPRITRRTRVLDRSLLAAYGELEAPRMRAIVRHHGVAMHLRRVRRGRKPSADKIATYARTRTEARMHGVLPAELPPNCTWVEAHNRGGHDVADDHGPTIMFTKRDYSGGSVGSHPGRVTL